MWTVALNGGPRRVNHAACAINDKIYSFGGHSSSGDADTIRPMEVFELNTDTNRWRLLHPAIPAVNHPTLHGIERLPIQRYGHTVCAYKGKAYVWGGRNDRYGASAALNEFDPVACQWNYIPVTGSLPPARDGHSAVISGHHMYIFGGFEEDTQRYSRETYCLDMHTHHWKEVETRGEPPLWRDFHTAVENDKKMYVFGGRSELNGPFQTKEDFYSEILHVLDLETLEWTEPDVTGTVPCGRRSHSAWCYKGNMFLFGGYDGYAHMNDIFSYDPATKNWRQHNPVEISGNRPCPRRRQCTVAVNDKFFLFGGTGPSSSSTILSDKDDLHILDFNPSLYAIASQSVIHNFRAAECPLPVHIRMHIHNMTVDNDVAERGPIIDAV